MPGPRRSFAIAVSCLMALGSAAVQAGATAEPEYRPAFDPSRLKGPPAGKLNEVLVLGTPHLSGLPDSLGPDALAVSLAPLLARLAAWRPTAIATEDLSGLQCDSLRRYPSRYRETVAGYCPDPSAAGKATGLDVPAANAEAERLLAAWPATPSGAQRRHLAAVFLAAGEPGSALVQWLRLPQAERRAGDGLNEELAAYLDKRLTRRNESTQVAGVLAARMGLERLWSVDDHSADTPDPSDPAEAKAYGEAITRAWDNEEGRQRRKKSELLEAAVLQPDGLLAMYRAYNDPVEAMVSYRTDFGAAFAEPSPQGFGRNYLGYWETRNLRMVANIRDVLGRYPGTRMLAIVGASHKGYYEAYLNQMHDVHLNDVMPLLGEPVSPATSRRK